MVPVGCVTGRMLCTTLEDSGPTIAEGLDWISDLMLESPMALWSPSLESCEMMQAFLPLTPPAALMSESAAPTPATAGGARNDSEPVNGRYEPSANVDEESSPEPQAATAGSAVPPDAADELLGVDGDEAQPATTSAMATAPTSPAERRRVGEESFTVMTLSDARRGSRSGADFSLGRP